MPATPPPPPPIRLGLQLSAAPPLALMRALVYWARLIGCDSCLVSDSLQNFVPTALWDPQFTWAATQAPSAHIFLDWSVLLGDLARRAGRLHLGVGVTDPTRRHPVLLAQAILTLAHLTHHAPILGLGAGERLNVEPYGLDFTTPVGRLEEALQIIRACLAPHEGPITFHGRHYHLADAALDLRAPAGKTPRIWIAARGPRMLRLTGLYGDGWYPALIASPQEYAAKLQVVRDAARAAGRNPAAITPALYQAVLVAPTARGVAALRNSTTGRLGGMYAAAAAWRRFGVAHPFGADYHDLLLDFLPHRYDRATCERGLATVPPALRGYGYLYGTPEQIAAKLHAFGAAGMRHVVLDLIGQVTISARAGLYGLLAARRIARLLRSGP
ncbi:MAG TPA: LLM class flavin-dependent oxidoreductase [Chloroflexia bacterium]